MINEGKIDKIQDHIEEGDKERWTYIHWKGKNGLKGFIKMVVHVWGMSPMSEHDMVEQALQASSSSWRLKSFKMISSSQ